MQLYLIRHAQSENNALWERTGAEAGRNMDPALSELGLRQAQVLARFMAEGSPGLASMEEFPLQPGFKLTHLYSSLMQRAVATGTFIANGLDMPLLGWLDWHEGGGIYLQDGASGALIGYPGMDYAYFRQHYPRLVWPSELDPGGWWNRPFEERPQRWERARRVLDELFARHGETDHRVGIVTHGGFYNYFVKTLLGISQELEMWFVMRNAAITRIDYIDQEIRFIYQNRFDFMPSELISPS
jgi:2,3-bisphosphoglycerate-dependent phosphoglycerate mutase